MHFISRHSSAEDSYVFGTLIGVHKSYLYSANSTNEEIVIYRKQVLDIDGWELYWKEEISARTECSCSPYPISAAYGIIEDELFVASYGLKPSDENIKLHVLSKNLSTDLITNFSTDHNPDIRYQLCSECNSPYIAANPTNPSEIYILPWYPEDSPKLFSNSFMPPWNPEADPPIILTDYVQNKFALDFEAQTCTFLDNVIFGLEESKLTSNIGVLEFGKILYFQGDELIFETDSEPEMPMEIAEDSDLQSCSEAGFYRTPSGLQCFANENLENMQKCLGLFSVEIDEENFTVKFTKFATLSSSPIPPCPRICKFHLDSRMLICPYGTSNFTYIFGVMSLSEIAFISASNSTSPLYKAYQKLSSKKKFEWGDTAEVFQESENLGLSQNGLKQALGLPESYQILQHSMEEF